MKTSELQGAALDWAVRECEGISSKPWIVFNPSTNWAQGGPIIEREGIELFRNNEKNYWFTGPSRGPVGTGETLLVAAMRSYVASKLGDEVEIPAELEADHANV